MKKNTKILTYVGLSLLAATSAQGANLIVEGGFEDTPTHTGVANVNYGAWTGSQGVIETWQDGFTNPSSSGVSTTYDTYEGNYHVELALSQPGYIYQTVAVTAANAGLYDYFFAHGQRDDAVETLRFMVVKNTGAFDGLYQDVVNNRFDLNLGGDDVVLFDNTFNSSGTKNEWTTHSGAGLFTAVDGESYTIIFSSATLLPATARGNFLDDIRLGTDVVPEPSSAMLLGLAGLGFILNRKRS